MIAAARLGRWLQSVARPLAGESPRNPRTLQAPDPTPPSNDANPPAPAVGAAPAEAFRAPAFAPAPAPEPDPGTDETVKETIEALVIAFILAFVFRAFVVEAFIIPTGSMAPTLLGEHVTCHCPSCGYRFDTTLNSADRKDQVVSQNTEAACPMCFYPVQILGGTRVQAGDRILVDKFIYTFSDPKRWDVIVFKNPQRENNDGSPGPRTNFIKRLVGLPGEQVYLLDGDVFVAPAGSDAFTIARKTDPDANPHWERIQRAMWQPIYHSQYVPLVTGRPGQGRGTVDQLRDDDHAWDVPWLVADNNRGAWDLGDAGRPARRYRFEGGQGLIEFDFAPQDNGIGYANAFAVYPYNREGRGTTLTRRDHEPIEDIRLAVAVKPEGDDIMVMLSTTARLDVPDNGTETLSASIDSAGWVIVQATDHQGETRQLGEPVRGPALKPGVATEVELWVVDQQVGVWVGDRQVYTYDFGLTWAEVLDRPSAERLPTVAIGVDSDQPVELYRVELDRDVYYSGRYRPATGSIFRRQLGLGGGDLAGPLVLRGQTDRHDAEFYVIGDNTPASEDGRLWSDVNGWVQRRYFDGEPRTRVVPRGLVVGRAFFVYYPAPQSATHGDSGIIPDFGRMRFIH